MIIASVSNGFYGVGHNLRVKAREIDVHGLRVREALLRVEQALRDMLLQSATNLRVIVGRGNHSVNKIPVLKMAVLKAMRRYILDPFRPAFPGAYYWSSGWLDMGYLHRLIRPTQVL